MAVLTYPVNDMHPGIQPLGRFAGTPVVFVQLQGCDVKCPWCNVPETWQLWTEENPKWKRALSRWSIATAEEIAKACLVFRQRHVVITGGEPLMHDLSALVERFTREGFAVQVETSGTRTPSWHASTRPWVTVSPKYSPTLPLQRSMLQRADEVVFPMTSRHCIERLQQEVIPHLRKGVPVYLHVIGSAKLNAQAAEAAFQFNYGLTGDFARSAMRTKQEVVV